MHKPKQASKNPLKRFEEMRVVVVYSPHEPKIAKMMKMLESNYHQAYSRYSVLLLDAHIKPKIIPKKARRKQAIACRKELEESEPDFSFESDSDRDPESSGRSKHKQKPTANSHGKSTYICPVCAKILKNSSKLGSHMK